MSETKKEYNYTDDDFEELIKEVWRDPRDRAILTFGFVIGIWFGLILNILGFF